MILLLALFCQSAAAIGQSNVTTLVRDNSVFAVDMFHIAEDHIVQVPMMFQTLKCRYASHSSLDVVELPLNIQMGDPHYNRDVRQIQIIDDMNRGTI